MSTNNSIYEALENVGDADSHMRYIYENVPHHQDQIQYPESLRNGSTWSTILSLPNNIPRTSQVRLPTITEYSSEEIGQRREPRREKGKRRITDEFISPPTSLQIVNIGYRTPFKSSSQFFVRPSGIPLPSSEAQTQQNVLVGLGLPHTLAFENISSAKESRHSQMANSQFQSQPSNPFEGRPLPPHMVQTYHDDVDYTSTPVNCQPNLAETRSGGEPSHH